MFVFMAQEFGKRLIEKNGGTEPNGLTVDEVAAIGG